MGFKTTYRSPIDEAKRQQIFEELQARINSKNVSVDLADRVSYSHGFWPIACNWTKKGEIAGLPDVIVWPETTEEVATVLGYANDKQIPVIPYGRGSGVLGGVVPVRGGISLDLKRMSRLLEVSDVNLKARVQAGMNGMNFERELRRRGFTMGHIPQSLYCSSVGGWVATKAIGQFSTKYGGIEQMLMGLEAILPTGDIFRASSSTRRSAGPELKDLFVGSEGTLGVITELTFRILPEPETRFLQSYVFETIENALESIRKIMRRGAKPAVVRIYDEKETERHFSNFPQAEDKVMLVLVIEGDEKIAEVENEICHESCTSLGEFTGDKPVEHWFETRFDVTETSELPPMGVVFDTIETTIDWKHAADFHDKMIRAMESVKGVIMAFAHASHFYPQGVCFYFSFGGIPPEDQDPYDFYKKVWNAAMETCIDMGGNISHHHGIGIVRSRWFSKERSGEIRALKRIKKAIDPNNIMNPGKLRFPEQEKEL